MNHHRPGHTFLSSLGKKASYFLFNEIKNNKELKILEVACNMGTTTFELVKKFEIDNIISCDIDPLAIEKGFK